MRAEAHGRSDAGARGGTLMQQAGSARCALGTPRGERERLQALASFRIGPGSEPEFDALAALTARLTGMAGAAVTLVDGGREWVKACHGPPLGEVERPVSFGGAIVARGAPLVVEDAAADERYSAHPWVAGDPSARFYAGVPLIAPGGPAVGTLAVLDCVPRSAQDDLIDALVEAGAMLTPHLQRRREELLAQNLTAVIGFDGRFQRVSVAFESLLGWTPQEMVGHPVLEFVHPDDLDRTRARIERMASGYRGIGGFENRYRAKDGSYRWLLWNAQVVPQEKRFYSAGKDITDRKSKELALRESEARYRTLAENVSDVLIGHDLDGRINYVSRAIEGVTGFRPDELVGKDSYEIVHPDDRATGQETHERLLETLQPVRYVFRMKRKDGGWVWVENNTRIVRDQRSRPVGMQSVTRDVSETKAAVEALRAAEERFRSAFDDAPVGMTIVTMDRRIERVNAAFCELIGYSEDELVGRDPRDFVHPDDRTQGDRPLAEMLADERRTFALEERLLHRDGHVVWIRTTVSMMRQEGDDGPRLLAHTEDISERRQAPA